MQLNSYEMACHIWNIKRHIFASGWRALRIKLNLNLSCQNKILTYKTHYPSLNNKTFHFWMGNCNLKVKAAPHMNSQQLSQYVQDLSKFNPDKSMHGEGNCALYRTTRWRSYLQLIVPERIRDGFLEGHSPW